MNKSEILNTMKLLGIKEVTSNRQALNGTREFELPIKYPWGTNIRVASFKTGYVRNQNGASSNYQLNKVKTGDRYYKLPNGDYRKFTEYTRVLIPNERDRLEYLLNYCIKNYYIAHANQVANGEFIPKWKHENELQYARKLEDKVCNPEVEVMINGFRYKI